jgi:TRAP-type C4-dicarboxylate transport system permease small subunit
MPEYRRGGGVPGRPSGIPSHEDRRLTEEPVRQEDRHRVPLEIERAIAAAAMALICLISFANVVVRYLTDVSFAFTEEYSVFLLVVMTFVGSSLAIATDGHMRLIFFVERLGRLGRIVCGLIAFAVTAAAFCLLIWYGGKLTHDEFSFGETSAGLGNPTWIYTIWLPLLSLAALLRLIGRFRVWMRSGP